MIKRAMILAAGFGKRLQPLTTDCPKPLLKIGNKTLLSNTLELLNQFGIQEVVINVHYLKDKIISYLKDNKFKMTINISNENEEILDTGGGVYNALKHFSNEPFLVINPDTVWNSLYLKELKLMEIEFFKKNNNKCFILVVNKKKSFDQSFLGDFNLINNLINRKNKSELNYIYTGAQIIKPEVFSDFKKKVFSINKIWDKLIENESLFGFESKVDFLHMSTLKIYKELLNKFKH